MHAVKKKKQSFDGTVYSTIPGIHRKDTGKKSSYLN